MGEIVTIYFFELLEEIDFLFGLLLSLIWVLNNFHGVVNVVGDGPTIEDMSIGASTDLVAKVHCEGVSLTCCKFQH